MKDYPPPAPPKKKKKKKGSGSLPAPRSGYATIIMVFFSHLLILQYPDHHQNLISSSLYYSGPLHKISSQSVCNFLSNVVHRQTDKLTNQRYQKHNPLCQGGNNLLPNVIMLSLGGERLTPKVLDHYLHRYLGILPLLWCLFAHLLILEYPDHHQNLISFSLYYPGPLHKISTQSVHNFVSNVVHRQTNKQTNKPTLPKT